MSRSGVTTHTAGIQRNDYAWSRATAVVGATIYTMGGRDSFGALPDVEAITP